MKYPRPPVEQSAIQPDAATESYLHLRRCAVQALRKWIAPIAEDLADETMFRVFKAVRKGTSIDNPEAFTTAVARNVYREFLRQSKLEAPIPVDESIASSVSPSIDDSETDECMRFCLRKLSAEDRALMRRYHRSQDKEARMQIADELGITLETLRVRVHRIRVRLQECVRDCRHEKQEDSR